MRHGPVRGCASAAGGFIFLILAAKIPSMDKGILLCALLALALCMAFLCGCAAKAPQADAAGANVAPGAIPNATPSPAGPPAIIHGLPNPATGYCTSHGGRDILMTDARGNQYGVCVFPDGSRCEEWSYFRGECSPGNGTGNATPTSYLNGSGCGSILSHGGTYVLSADMNCSGTALTIAADNVTIDCAGHSITGSYANAGSACFYGVSDPEGSARPEVENCAIRGFCSGISLYSSPNSTIVNDTVASDLYGIYLVSSSGGNISSNFIFSNSFEGLFISSSAGNMIYNNFFNNSVNLQSDGSRNFWNTTLSCGGQTNIIGGGCMGGNFWTQPAGGGWSDNTSKCSPGADGICASAYAVVNH
jgi:parallel beta-helix repeat protein